MKKNFCKVLVSLLAPHDEITDFEFSCNYVGFDPSCVKDWSRGEGPFVILFDTVVSKSTLQYFSYPRSAKVYIRPEDGKPIALRSSHFRHYVMIVSDKGRDRLFIFRFSLLA